MQKHGRKKAADPIQEELRSHKDTWNKACSEFISKLIAYKQGLNGRGSAKFSIAPSKITEPMPQEVISLISELSSEFSHLAQYSNKIIDLQKRYHDLREQKQKELHKDASNKLTRFWANLKGKFSSSEFKTERLSMLSLTANIRSDCLKFQEDILSQDKNSIIAANTLFHKIEVQFKALSRYSNSIIKLMELKSDTKAHEENPEQNQEPVDSELAAVNFIINDLVFAIKLPQLDGLDGNRYLSNKIIQEIKKYERDKDLSKKKFYFNQLDILYKEFLKTYYDKFIETFNHHNLKLNVNKSSFKDLFDLYNRILSQENDLDLAEPDVKLANFISRWVKNKALKFNPSGATSSIRSNIFESMEDFKKILNSFMNMLEKDLDKNELKSFVIKLTEQLAKIEELFSILYDMNSAEELSDQSQADRLQNMIRRKKLREMTTGF